MPRPDQRQHHACHSLSPAPWAIPQCCPSSQAIRDITAPLKAGREAKPRSGLLIPSLSPRYDEGSGGSGDEGRDEAHKREWNLFYQKQMRLRKVRGGDHSRAPGGFPLTCTQPFSVLSCSGQDASQALHVILQGKDPKIEEFVPPGQYRNVPRGLWAFLGVDGGWLLAGSGTPERRRWSGRAHPFSLQMRTVL